MNTPATTPFVEAMRAAALPASGLAWLDAARAESLRAFLAQGLPDTRDELWKYTSLRALQQHRPALGAAGAATVDESSLALEGVPGPRAVFVDGAFRADLSRLGGLAPGASLVPLSQALRDAPEPLRFALGAHAEGDDGCVLLNRALAREGCVLRIADGVEVAEPLQIVYVGTGAGGPGAWHLRDFVEVGRGARLRMIERHLGDAAGQLANLFRTITLREGARLDWTMVQSGSRETTLLRRSDCVLHDGATVDLHALELGGKLARHELRVDLLGARSRFASRGAFVLHGRQHADTELLVTHRGRDSVSDSLWRGVADDRARGVVHGRIVVQPGADGADGSFYNKNLLLSRSAEIDTRPALEIHADEVKANHGATVGQLDERALFYLQSRGIPLELARRMLVRAFCAVVLEGIEPAGLRAHCDALLAEQLPELAA